MKEEYCKHLKSDDWNYKRNMVMARAGKKCELCGDSADHVHHIRYPKNLKQDSLRNLLAVCKTCHDKLHGLHQHDNAYLKASVLDDLLISIYDYMSNVRASEREKEWYLAIRDIYNHHIDKVNQTD